MNHWLQTKQYQCPVCKAIYLHDRAYFHVLFRCSARRVLATPRTCAIGKHLLNLSLNAHTTP